MIGSLGMTRKSVGAWGERSRNARHWRKSKQLKRNWLQRKVTAQANQYAPLNSYRSRLPDTPNASQKVDFPYAILILSIHKTQHIYRAPSRSGIQHARRGGQGDGPPVLQVSNLQYVFIWVDRFLSSFSSPRGPHRGRRQMA